MWLGCCKRGGKGLGNLEVVLKFGLGGIYSKMCWSRDVDIMGGFVLGEMVC